MDETDEIGFVIENQMSADFEHRYRWVQNRKADATLLGLATVWLPWKNRNSSNSVWGMLVTVIQNRRPNFRSFISPRKLLIDKDAAVVSYPDQVALL